MLADIIPKIAGFEKAEEKHNYNHRCSNASIGERCIRQSVYQALNYEAKPFGDRFSLVVDDSSWHEQLTADWIRKSGFKLHSEQLEIVAFEINGKFIKGHIDGIITDLTGLDRLYEHKAINHFTFAKYELGNIYPIDYACQCVCYILGLQKLTGIYIPAILLLKNKNTSRYLEYEITYDPQTDIVHVVLRVVNFDGGSMGTSLEKSEIFIDNIVARIKARFELIDKHVASNELPERAYSIEEWQCQYCRYAEICWKGYDEEVLSKEAIDVKDFDADLVAYCERKAQISKLNSDKKLLEAEQSATEEKIKKYLIENQLTAIRSGEYGAINEKGFSKKFCKELLTSDVVAAATKITPKIDCKIFKIKKEDENGHTVRNGKRLVGKKKVAVAGEDTVGNKEAKHAGENIPERN